MATKLDLYMETLQKMQAEPSENPIAKKSPIKNSGGSCACAIITAFLGFQNQIKIFHWQTKSYSQHKAFQKLYESLTEHIDDFVESYMGRYERIMASPSFDFSLQNYSENFLSSIEAFVNFLQDELPTKLGEKDTDLLNIRDSILGDVQQVKYLLTFP
jgi:Family of unknown function (DUF5856)